MSTSSDNMVANEILCYISNKFGKIAMQQLKSIVSNFYVYDQVAAAKDILVSEIDKLDLNKWPRPARRRPSIDIRDKLKTDIDDIFAMFVYVDEQKLSDRLPLFVASNPDMLPSNNWSEGDVIGLMNRFASIEEQLSVINDKLIERSTTDCNKLTKMEDQLSILSSKLDDRARAESSIISEIQAVRQEISMSTQKKLRPDDNRLNRSRFITARNSGLGQPCGLSIQSNDQPNTSMEFGDIVTGTDESDDGRRDDRQAWATLPANPISIANNDDFSQVISKKRKRTLTAELRAARLEANKPAGSSSATNSNRLIGNASATTHLKAAKDLTKKSVYCVNNVDTEVTCAEMSEFVEAMKVRVISCFETKTKYANSKAFRICINSDDKCAFLDISNWPCNIVLRAWTFKNSERTTSAGGTNTMPPSSQQDEPPQPAEAASDNGDSRAN